MPYRVLESSVVRGLASASIVLLSLAVAGCGGGESAPPTEPASSTSVGAPDSESTASTASAPAQRLGAATELAETWLSPLDEADNVDSVAFWAGELAAGDDALWVLATAKESHRLLVYDARSGEVVRSAGREGEGLGSFRRPNGIVVTGDLVWVAERDNRRVQVLRLPGLEPLGEVGADHLERPYGLTVLDGPEPDSYRLYVTDNYEGPNDEPPPDAALDERVKQFRVTVRETAVEAEHVRSFGAVEGPGRLQVVESIFADATSGRLLIAEEQTGAWSAKVYDLSGGFTGTLVGLGDFGDEAEGIALYPCGDEGYWILTDQRKERTVFHVYERRSLARVGAFSGAVTANTDGVVVTPRPFGGFPEGAFFAVHDDQGVSAFDWRAIRGALALDTCVDLGS